MGIQDTWIGLTVAVYICLVAFSGVEVIHGEIAAVNGEKNASVLNIPQTPARMLNESPINSSGNWLPYMENLLDTPQNEQEQQGADYQGVSMGSAVYNLFVRGTFGFSGFAHDLVGLQHGATFVSWLIDLVQWFLVIGNALILLQIMGRFLPGGG